MASFTFPFEPASNDQSIGYLGRLFGSMGGVIPASGGYTPESIAWLGSMFSTFNAIILAVGVLVIVYTTVVGVLLTAHEGQFMGKNWNNMWIPVRMVLGVATLIPTGSGYSAIQLFLMWIVLQGVGAADALWAKAVAFVDVTGSPYAQLSIPRIGLDDTFRTLFQSMVCDESSRMTVKSPFTADPHESAGSYYCYANSLQGGAFCTDPPPPFNPNSHVYAFGPATSCGLFYHCSSALLNCDTTPPTNNEGRIACASCDAQLQALGDIVPTFRQIAHLFVMRAYQYANYWRESRRIDISPPLVPEWIANYCSEQGIDMSNCNGKIKTGQLPNPMQGEISNISDEVVKTIIWPYGMKPELGSNSSFIQTSADHFINQVESAVQRVLQDIANEPDTIKDDQLREAVEKGWIFAGSYYHVLANMNKGALDAALPNIAMENAAEEPSRKEKNPLYETHTDFTAAATLLKTIKSQLATKRGGLESVMQEGGEGIKNAVNDGTQAAATAWKASLSTTSSGGNPLAKLISVGQQLIWTAEAVFVALVAAIIIVGLFACFEAFVLGTGVSNPGCGVLSFTSYFLVPALLAMIGLMISFGGMLAIYIPLVPYIIFTFGAIAWMLSTIEAMVAGPLVAVGILSPSGQHELFGKAEPAIMMVFYIFLRPSLMIFGLVAAMLLTSVVKMMIDAAFDSVKESIWSGADSDPVAFILFLGAYVFFIITAFNKCFAAIYLIPQQVMTWIGGHHAVRDAGEAQAEGEVKGGAQRVASGTAGAATGGAGMMKEHMGGVAKGRQEKTNPPPGQSGN